MIRTVIIGAGPAGIGAGLGCCDSTVLLDRSNKVGGLCKSTVIDGAVFDLGGHSFHTPHPKIRERVFSSLSMFEQQRDARCFVDGKLIPYPFQQNFHLLDERVIEKCENGLKDTTDGSDALNYEQYLTLRFGAGIAEKFLLPYNRKLWGGDLKRLACDWARERVASPQGVKQNAMIEGKRAPLKQNQLVSYPAKGGFEEIFKKLATQIPNISLSDEVYCIDTNKHLVYRRNGEALKYKNIIATNSVKEFLELIANVPKEITQDVTRLECLKMKVVMVVINHKVDTPIQRIYAADPNIPFHKLAINHNSSDYLRSLPTHGIIAEVSSTPEKSMTEEELKKSVVESLLELQIIKRRMEVQSIQICSLKHGYPVPTHDRFDVMERIRTWLRKKNIYLAGRFAEWSYINSDESMNRGYHLARSLSGR